MLAVGTGALLDDRRADRETAQAERLGWRVSLATGDAFQDSDLAGVDLSGVALARKDLSRVSLRSATLRSTVLRDTDIAGADLTRSNLNRAVLTGVSLVGADLSDADLSHASFSGSDLSGVDLTRAASVEGARFDNVCYDYATRWPTTPPPLDWRSCWSGYTDNETPVTLRTPPDEGPCDLSDLRAFLPNYLNGLAVPDDDQLCSYIGYLDARGVQGTNSDKVFTGSYACGQAATMAPEVLAQISDPARREPRDLEAGRGTLFAAAKYLCPERAGVIIQGLRSDA